MHLHHRSPLPASQFNLFTRFHVQYRLPALPLGELDVPSHYLLRSRRAERVVAAGACDVFKLQTQEPPGNTVTAHHRNNNN